MDAGGANIAATNPIVNSPEEIQLHELNGTGNAATDEAPSPPDSTSATDQKPEPDKVYYFGCRLWHPQWLQVFANAKFYTFILCLFVIIEGAIASGLVSTVLSTVERRYHFSSTAAGLIPSIFEITTTLVIVFVSYVGGRGHKPKWLGTGCLLQGIGCLVFMSPQFIFFNDDPPEVDSNRFQVCSTNRTEIECAVSNTVAYLLLLLGQIIIGIGSSTLYSIGISYLDELVHPKYISVHLGFIYVVQVIGPALGFGIGGAVLSVYVDPWVSTDLNESDPNYVGAWWISFLATSILSMIMSIPFFLYPQRLKDFKEVEKARLEEMAKKGEVIPPSGAPIKQVIIEFFKQLKALDTNLTFVLNCLSLSVVVLPVNGLVVFAPKFVENQFHFPASEANLIVGATAILTASFGAATGALVLYFFKNPATKGKNAALFIFIMSVIGLPFSFGYLAYCPSVDIVGVNIRNTSGINSLSCVAQCNCNTSQYEPVCGADGFTYASPCNAGCTIENSTDPDNMMFSNCGCILEGLSLAANTSFSGDGFSGDMSSELASNSSATLGFCNRMERCNLVAVFLILIGLAVALNYCRTVPLFFISLRCVAHEQRHLSLGVISFFVRTFGAIPGPLITGAIFDSVCQLRHELQEQCGLPGNCLVYDNEALALRSAIMLFVGMAVSAVFAFFVWFVYPKKKANFKQDNEETAETENSTNTNSVNNSEH